MLIFLVIISFLFSAFFSSSEIIYTVADKIKIRIWSKSGHISAQKTKKLIRDPDNYLIPILIGNNIANVAYTTFFTYLIAEMNWNLSHFETTLYLTMILVMFAEIIPKILAQTYSDQLSISVIYPFLVIKTILTPVSYIVGKISRLIMKYMKLPDGNNHLSMITKSDIRAMVDEAAQKRTVKYKDAMIIKKLLNLGHKKIREIMIHRKSVVSLDMKSPLYRLKKLFVLTSFSKIIIYENDLDNIKGVVFVRDLLSSSKNIEDIIRPVLFVRESGTILSLFKIFKREKASICVVIDEFGGCLGIVTMHDILEQIVGKVEDPHNINQGSDRGIIYRQDQKLFILDGTADLEELRKMIKSIIGEEKNVMNCKNETINGYVINRLKRIPEQGEIFELEGLKYRIMKAKKNFVETIIIQL